jgi:NAD(P)-dependent dehydrogenase (short-subunit alcohol dehydrogenase family)
MELKNKVAVITGSTRGLGLAIAKRYSEAGASVVVSSRTVEAVENTVAKLQDMGFQIAAKAGDAGDLKHIQDLAQLAIDTFGKIDIWVNNAGVSAPYGPTIQIDHNVFQRVIQTNILGTYYGSMVALDHFLKQDGVGKLINVLGRGARRPAPMQNAYGSSKAWMLSFSLALAQENKDTNVGIYVFSPGMVDTDLLRKPRVLAGYESKIEPLKTVMRFWANSPDVPARKAVWIASSATDGRTGLHIRVLSPARMILGVLKASLRSITQRPVHPIELEIETISPKNSWI